VSGDSSEGRVLGGRYQLVREIARGGMATVWEAHDTVLERPVAVKLLHPQFADEPEFLERFRREARAAASLSHPNIVPIFDVGEDAATRTPFIVMELVRGGNLKDYIRRAAPLTDQQIRSIGAALASTLEYAHRHGLVHRDVKPHNILLGEDGRPRLTDFGIAQALASSALTRTGTIMGSVHYVAPELVRGRPATAQSDVYGLGAVLYEMATGRVPFTGETDMAVALAHVEENPPLPRTFNAHLDRGLERTLLRALAKNPEERFASAADLTAALRSDAAAPAVSAAPTRSAAAATQRIAVQPRPTAQARAQAASAPVAVAPRRTARPQARRGPGGGVLALILAMAAVLVALGAGFFGLATLSREGVATPGPTSPAPTARPTAAPKPAAVATDTPVPQPTDTPVPPTATAAPATATPVPPTATPIPQSTPTPLAIAMPQLRGRRLDDALAAVQAAGLTATVRGINANVDLNVVADQTPDAGATLGPGTTVTIIVGTGMTAMPDVTNRTPEQARQVLQSSSFRVTAVNRRDPRVPAGQVIGTNPAAGVIVPRGSEVELSISAGR
jgi:eukaryotic-like serine/threonine-protein kinase